MAPNNNILLDAQFCSFCLSATNALKYRHISMSPVFEAGEGKCFRQHELTEIFLSIMETEQNCGETSLSK